MSYNGFMACPELTATAEWNAAYDYEDRLTSITGPGGLSDSFTYNGLDTRVSKTDGAGTHTFRREGAGVTAPVLNDGSAEYTPGVSRTSSSGTAYTASDSLGSNVMQTNGSQAVTSSAQFDAFGALVSSSGTHQGPFGFNGQFGYQTDSDDGLMLLGHRYYDPSTGRFLTRDPAEYGTNWYDYCGNNPLSYSDPSGLHQQGGGSSGGGGSVSNGWSPTGKPTGTISFPLGGGKKGSSGASGSQPPFIIITPHPKPGTPPNPIKPPKGTSTYPLCGDGSIMVGPSIIIITPPSAGDVTVTSGGKQLWPNPKPTATTKPTSGTTSGSSTAKP